MTSTGAKIQRGQKGAPSLSVFSASRSPQTTLVSSQPWQAHVGTAPGTVPLPGRQLLMSSARSMPSGQAQVNLGEWGLICGAGRHRYSQPPLGRAVLSHQFTPAGEEDVQRDELMASNAPEPKSRESSDSGREMHFREGAHL